MHLDFTSFFSIRLKGRSRGLSGLLGLVCCVLVVPNSAADIAVDINWPEFMSSNDLVWREEAHSTILWEHGVTLGNGAMGAIIYKPNAKSIRWYVSRTDIVDHREYESATKMAILQALNAGRLPTGYFTLPLAGIPLEGKCSMRHSLLNGEAIGHFETTRGTIDFVSFVHPDDVLIVEITATGEETGEGWTYTTDTDEGEPGPETGRWLCCGGVSPYEAYPAPSPEKQVGNVTVRTQELPGDPKYFTSQPGQYSCAWQAKTEADGRKVLYAAMKQTYPGTTAEQDAVDHVNQAVAKGVPALIQENRVRWHTYNKKSFVSIPDPRFESFYWIQVHRLGAMSRPGGPIIDLRGPWYTHGESELYNSWNACWWEINGQIAYLPFPSTNHIPEGNALLEAFERNLANLEANTPDDCDCVTHAVVTGQDLKGSWELMQKTSQMDYSTMAWLIHNCWRNYKYTMDKEMLQRLYPILKKSTNWMIYNLVKEGDGKYHYPVAWSPELGNFKDCTYHLANARWHCLAMLEAAETLNIDDPLIPKWHDVLDNLVDFPIINGAYAFGSDKEMTRHRHWNQLIFFYPTYLVNWDDDSKHAILEKTIEKWGAGGTGYSKCGAMGMYASMGKGDEALEHLGELVKNHVLPNTTHEEFNQITVSGATTAADGIAAMLLQSWGGKLRVFPAVPSTWNDVAFHQLRAEGAFLVSAVRKNGATQFVRVFSEAGEPCVVKTDLARPLTATGSRDFTVQDVGDNSVSIDLRKGEFVVLHTRGATPDLAIRPVNDGAGNCNCFVDNYKEGNCSDCEPVGVKSALPGRWAGACRQSSVSADATISVYDISGRCIARRPAVSGAAHHGRAGWNAAAGVFIAEISQENRTISMRKDIRMR